ncbi:RNA polymerase sigma-70 factor (ECF subfamily) [Rhizobium sp. BK313]|uniref:sigma-70 family RNA polymerase sigma factor n=1 Tax=Rhizobium sp. BK313 TaxID=2587081 RepID=UPI0010D56369|nr:sigma-70 family RNA polymerase sigma factor [Rhizobium sp. BK313]MBB3452752.1 RNA polymerase sigma-70 factor (ECF subfamily) [Rhizobium sp. BK313]
MQALSSSTSIEEEIVTLIPALRSFAFRFVRSSSDADDLVQEAIFRALGHLDHFRPGSCMKSWLFTIMRNAYCSAYRRRIRESCGGLDDAVTYDVPVLAGQDWALRAVDVDAALRRLSAGERKAILLVANGISYEDAAVACRCKVGTIKSRVSRGRLHLAEMLGDADPVAAISIN